MTQEQFAALKPGESMVALGGRAVLAYAKKGNVVGVVVDGEGHWIPYQDIALPDTETPPLFEEDGA